ncbi:MAG: FMN-binding glutamate synthase family protein [Bacillota bacterium]|jgi:glutamate synthase domain-containing protein 2|nr:FMN-binding glutamate synthase family protein [Bacillota bacterium]HPZ54816.1 FMN-binding glutamate synthase family protein [Bacillota bacterium]HQD17733.1 FMN-binding glutamate synthase family protein [Bacillota bacterium]
MIGEALIQGLIEKLLERMREVETIKGPQNVHGYSLLRLAAIAERAKHGKPVMEPYGSSREFMGLDDLVFLPAMIDTFPVDPFKVRTKAVIGAKAARPLELETPIMISAMAYGLSVTEATKIAVAKASARAGTATNSGDAGFCEAERRYARKYIVQFNRARYGNSEDELRRADAIEIRFGQGALAGLPEVIEGDDMDEDIARQLGVRPGQSVTRPIRHKEMSSPSDLKAVVERLRSLTGGVPIGAKIAAGRIEADLAHVVDAGCDFITVDGAQGGTAGSPEVIINNVGLPIIYAIPRVNRYLVERGVRANISLIACGGLKDAGDFMKALALGADAVYSAQSVLTAMVYGQAEKLPPGTSPAELYLYWGKHGDKLDIELAAKSIANFVKASTQEMAMIAGAVGKNDLNLVNMDDLAALTEHAAVVTGVQRAW